MGRRQWGGLAGALRQRAGPSSLQEEVAQGASDLCLAMEDSQLPLVRSANGAHNAWSRLEEHFEKRSLANKLFFRRRFYTMMMEEGDDVQEHIAKVKTMVETLDALALRSAR